MAINADKIELWKQDIAKSVDLFNRWFVRFAPKTFRIQRAQTTQIVEDTLRVTRDFAGITAEFLRVHPECLPTLRMATCPPLARDRLVGLAEVRKGVVIALKKGVVPSRNPDIVMNELSRIASIIHRMLDRDIMPWIDDGRRATKRERLRAATIVADRLCGSLTDPIIRNAQEARQLTLIEKWLRAKGYLRKPHLAPQPLNQMEPGTYCFRMNVVVGRERTVRIPVDAVIQPKGARLPSLPVLIEAKSAGDFANVNKRRKEEATKIRQLRATYGDYLRYLLLLCGYFDAGYLGYEAAEGIDWIWEHRIEDMDQLGL
jgi:hypothetical protein